MINNKGIQFSKTRTAGNSVKVFTNTPADYRQLVTLLDIREDLVSQGIADAEVQQMKTRNTKQPLPLFLVKTRMTEKLQEVLRLAMLTVSFEKKQRSTESSQCYRCQRYGHTQRNCRLAERCVKCDENVTELPLKYNTRIELFISRYGCSIQFYIHICALWYTTVFRNSIKT
ncbi:unnamed protein product [Acanthoscelides obtectus]|uniref:CCHC-type domain-containing protein n=1 Tax=Acanthoscelides obtectus TaxID=200917 RepID=A0A9P0K4P3_ACAOB|nr:unnamed protein product [Acanthoscelides obtectus]CAK1666617.1 hypothetical protein AOBTE_LOCUS25400 [Acanthoscelides obtectus]